ncbi:MAG: hypothetical protein GEU79_17920 [Acidimicrobiia bacterium]|nr:hypothetical protein [Acidimicrobiia bacterium]
MSEPRNRDNWAKPIESFHVDEVAPGAFKGNVEGRRPSGPLQGFGQLWQKSYRVEIPGVTPEEIISTWKENFGEFWHPSNRFYAPAAGIAPGEVALVGGGRGPTRVTTGVRVMYADERSWSYITPEGHPWSAFITFSADTDETKTTVAKTDILLRAADPLYEAAFRIYTSRFEDKIWTHTLTQLARHFGSDATVEMNHRLVDKKRQWSQMGNIWKNSAIRTLLRRDRIR